MKRDLTNSHKQDIEKMGKYLKDKQCDFDILLADKRQLENMIKDLIAEKEDANKQKEIIANEKEKLLQLLSEKEKLLTVLNEKINNSDKSLQEQKVSSQEMENLKIKMKKLAANLKKKAQNEKDLLKQVKDLESSIADKDKSLEKLHSDINEVTEKWTLEKSEKEQSRNELNAVLCQKADLENENASLKNKFVSLEEELENSRLMHEGQVRQLEDEIQKTYKICNDLQMIEQDYKSKFCFIRFG